MNYLINQLTTVSTKPLPSLSGNAAHPEPHPSPTSGHSRARGEPRFSIYRCSTPKCRASATEQEKDEIRFMRGWKLKELEKCCMAATAVRGDKTGNVERI